MSAWDVVMSDVDEDFGKRRLDVCQVVVRIVVEVVDVVELM